MKPRAGGLFINWLSNVKLTTALCTIIATSVLLHTPHHSHQSPLIVSLTSMWNNSHGNCILKWMSIICIVHLEWRALLLGWLERTSVSLRQRRTEDGFSQVFMNIFSNNYQMELFQLLWWPCHILLPSLSLKWHFLKTVEHKSWWVVGQKTSRVKLDITAANNFTLH